MKVQSLHLKHFKRFCEQSFDFTDPETGLAKNLIVLVGKNGSGKTSILQAIAAVLGNATGRLEKLSDLANSNWQQPTSIKMAVEFSPTEITATQEFYQENQLIDNFIKPSAQQFVTLTFQNDKVHANTPEILSQFKGRDYAKQIIKTHPEGYKLFEQVGTVFFSFPLARVGMQSRRASVAAHKPAGDAGASRLDSHAGAWEPENQRLTSVNDTCV
jgi:predicted ATP-dependent endonuclease of OLD family